MNEMNIESATYLVSEVTNQNFAVQATIDGITMLVPLDPANRHYAEILRQVESGILTIATAESTEE